ncbi:hypothetical protein KKF91_04305 [Myxococcota bacterium]|nr:hypothetical protein [Myxococcota bacterium]
MKARAAWWLLNAALMPLGALIAAQTLGHFSGGPVLMRPWILISNGALLSINLIALLGLSWVTPSRLARKLLLLALLATIAHGALPILSPGPWSPGAWPLWALRLLVFLPSLLRDGAGLREAWGRGGARVALGFSLSLALSAALLIHTPVAITARLHALCGVDWAWLAPMAAMVTWAAALWRAREAA